VIVTAVRQERDPCRVRLTLRADKGAERPLHPPVPEQAALVQRQPATSPVEHDHQPPDRDREDHEKRKVDHEDGEQRRPQSLDLHDPQQQEGSAGRQRDQKRPDRLRAVFDDQKVWASMGDMHRGTPELTCHNCLGGPLFPPWFPHGHPSRHRFSGHAAGGRARRRPVGRQGRTRPLHSRTNDG